MKKFLIILLIVVIVLLVAGGLYVFKLFNDFNQQITDSGDKIQLNITDFFSDPLPDELNILLIAVDAAEGTVNDGKLVSMMLAKIDKNSEEIVAVDIPLTDLTTGIETVQAIKDKLTGKYGIRIDKYLVYNLTAFVGSLDSTDIELPDISELIGDNIGDILQYDNPQAMIKDLGMTAALRQVFQAGKDMLELLGNNVKTDLTVVELIALARESADFSEDSVKMVELSEINNYFK